MRNIYGGLLCFSLGCALCFATPSAMAELTSVATLGATTPSAKYIRPIAKPNEQAISAYILAHKKELKGHKIAFALLSYPQNSDFSYGKVRKHRLQAKHFPSMPIFVIGGDKASIKWAKTNALYLQKIHALGLVTNVKSRQETTCIEKLTGLHLTPANIDGLGSIIGTTHYPVLIDKGWVVQ